MSQSRALGSSLADDDYGRGTLFKRKDFLEVEEEAKLHPARTYYYRKAASVDQLIEQSSRKLSEAPDDVKALSARAGGLMRKKLYARAVEDYTAILALVPDDSSALYSRGSAYDKLGQTSDAIVGFCAAPAREVATVQRCSSRLAAAPRGASASPRSTQHSQLPRIR